MKVSDLKAGFLSIVAAGTSSLCCLLPLTIIVLGLGTGAFMSTTMKYRNIFIPAGVIGVSLGWLLYGRERRRCHTAGCRMTAGPLNLALLLLASLIVAGAVVLNQFPDVTADLLIRATSRRPDSVLTPGSAADHSTMKHEGEMK